MNNQVRSRVLADILDAVSLTERDLAEQLSAQRLSADEDWGLHPLSGILVESSLAPASEKRLVMGIASIMGSISEFLDGSSEDINLLPDKLRALLEQQSNDQESLNQRYHRISMLMSQIHEIHPSLDQDLIKALTDLQPKIQREDASLQAFISTTIEASLVKLSVIRARAHLSLYNGSTPSALEAAYRKAQQDESALEADELELDRQLAKYTQVMQLVNGSEKDSPFAQIIEDWALVKKETDECRRDLRRLGWTGD